MTQSPLTLDQVAYALPKHLKGAATQSLTDRINTISSDPEAARTIRENFVSYSSVLQDKRYSTDEYINAVAYVSYKLMGYNNEESYARAMPDRYNAMVARGDTSKTISAHVASFTKGKLVNTIMEQTLTPIWVLNQDAVQSAINTLVTIMTDDDVGAMARVQAAKGVLEHVKKPETQQVELSVAVKETDELAEFRRQMRQMAEQQQQVINSGVSPKQIADMKIVGSSGYDD